MSSGWSLSSICFFVFQCISLVEASASNYSFHNGSYRGAMSFSQSTPVSLTSVAGSRNESNNSDSSRNISMISQTAPPIFSATGWSRFNSSNTSLTPTAVVWTWKNVSLTPSNTSINYTASTSPRPTNTSTGKI